MKNQKGLALPTALLLVLVVMITGSVFSKVAIANLVTSKQDQFTIDTFQISEGAIHNALSSMSARAHLWRQKVPLANNPQGYQEYSQLDYGATNGIPSCSGQYCLRNFYPMGGGLLKNFGPIGGAGDTVDQSKTVWNQISLQNLPTPDLTLNGVNSFFQIERLDEAMPSGQNFGAELTNNPTGGTGPKNIRFRITAKTYKLLKERIGESTIVVISEMPST